MMTQETLNKLMELKQLFEQGILTKEELELEKAKILGTTEHQELENEEQIPIPEDIESEVAEENEEITQPTAYTYPYAMPSMMPAQIQPESPANEHSLTSEYNLIDDEEDNNDHTMRWIVAICVAGLLVLLLICYSQCGGSADTPPNESDVCDTAYVDSVEVYEEESNFGDEYSAVVNDDDIICSAIKNYLRGDGDAVVLTRTARYSLSESTWPEVYCTECGFLDSPASYKDLVVYKVGAGQYKYECVCPKHDVQFVDRCTIHAFLDTDGTVKIERITWDDVVDAPL